jgi:hypothetical protein
MSRQDKWKKNLLVEEEPGVWFAMGKFNESPSG